MEICSDRFKIYRGGDCIKKKIILSISFVMSLLPMLMNQYGGRKGVQEITGLINLFNPIGIASVVLFIVGVWIPFKQQFTGKVLGALGTIGIVVSEIYKYFTWHTLSITGEISMQHSIRFAFPEFYIGLIVSLVMVAAYFIINKKTDLSIYK